nr:PREDICTED: beta-2-microglobulin-like [Latimeria chalumnae]|eukprot:XP_006001004.1 PREDICTED: beta-2-microglobulin-like [Latimeria chalumnae]
MELLRTWPFWGFLWGPLLVTGVEEVMPDIYLYMENPITFGKKNRLNCYAMNFFPPNLRAVLLENENPLLVKKVAIWDLTFNLGGNLQLLLSVEVVPKLRDSYSCTMEHLKLRQNRTIVLDAQEPYKPAADHSETAALAIGIIVGIIGMLVGIVLIAKH